jgi:hypothetical protein
MIVKFTPTGKSDTTDAAADRRRPGRIAYTSRFLIDLLREKPTSSTAEDLADAPALTQVSVKTPGDTYGDLAPAVGICVSVILSLVLWAIIFLIIWPFIHGDGGLDIKRTRSSGRLPAHSAADTMLVRYADAHVVIRPYVLRPATSLPWGASF